MTNGGISYDYALNLNCWQRDILLDELKKMEKEKSE